MDAKSFIMGNSTPGYSFIKPGDRIVGQITGEPTTRQMKVWRNGKPTDELAVWPSGEPKFQLVIPLITQFRNYEGIREPNRQVPDDGRRTVYVNGKHREAALRMAIRQAGVEWLEVGGWYDETYTGDDYESSAGIKPKLADIKYAPPSQAYRQAQAAQAAAQQQHAQVHHAEQVYAAQAQISAQAQPGWQQPGWSPQAAVPSHHGNPADMPQWATTNAPVSTPPVQPVSTPPAAAGMSTIEQLRAARSAATFTEEPPF